MRFSLLLFYFLSNVESREYRLGLLCPRSHVRLGWDVNAAAATMALAQAEKDGLLAGSSIRLEWRDDKCNGKLAAGLAVELYEAGIDGFIGPPCSSGTISSGLLASYWNLPMFTPASTDPSLSDKSVYTTLVRMGPPFNKMGAAIAEIFDEFEWHTFAMVSRLPSPPRNVFCDYASRSIDVQFRDTNVTLSEWQRFKDRPSVEKIDYILTRLQQRARVIILCADLIDEHNFLRRAKQKGMLDGGYAFFVIYHLPPANVETPWIINGETVDEMFDIYKDVRLVTLSSLAGDNVQKFRVNVVKQMAEEPWFHDAPLLAGKIGSEYSPFLFDVVYLYALALNHTLVNGGNPKNGSLMYNNAREHRFKGQSGDVVMDKNGDRDPDYSIWTIPQNEEEFSVWAEVRMTASIGQRLTINWPGNWKTVDGKPIRDTPLCGFMLELCPPDTSGRDTSLIGLAVGTALISITLSSAIMQYRKKKLNHEMHSMMWKLKEGDFGYLKGVGGSSSCIMSMQSLSASHADTTAFRGESIKLALYDGNVVTVRTIECKTMNIDKKEVRELNTMRLIQHENVTRFLGATVEDSKMNIIMTHCSRGRLQDIIGNDDIKLDWMFKSSIMQDLSNGLSYLHNSSLGFLGNLTSDSCVVDKRWVLKITDYGLLHIRRQHFVEDIGDYQKYKEMLWTAPEFLRSMGTTIARGGSLAADVYSFGIILQEVIYRCLPFGVEDTHPEMVIDRVIASENPPYRPNLCLVDPPKTVDKKVYDLMVQCWDEVPANRPSMNEVRRLIRGVNKGRKVNIMDHMLTMMEKYATNLEEIVNSRTVELLEEKKKTDTLLHSMLPRSVADRLKKGLTVDPEMYESVTIYFSDIVGFTSLSADCNPMEVVNLLNDLYTLFDGYIAQHDVYKIETIGDAYMVASGLPARNEGQHVFEIANMSLDLLYAVQNEFRIRHQPNKHLLLRIGLHTGPCCAGVVGLKMPRYCLFGDTVNMASRMESNGEALQIHVSETVGELLLWNGGYQIEPRGQITVKGKGVCSTFWLKGKKDTE